jgi:hypothetical protein
MTRTFLPLVLGVIFAHGLPAESAEGRPAAPLRVATFACDLTPPLGQPLVSGDLLKTVEHPLLAKGIVIDDGQARYVLCAVDWCELCNASHLLFRQKIAAAAGADVAHVAVQCLHQHSAPLADGDAQKLLEHAPSPPPQVDAKVVEMLTDRLAAAVKQSLGHWEPFDQVGTGQAKVERVASSRRVAAPGGKILVRYSACKNPALRAMPEGLIDPLLKTITLARSGKPLVRLHYYATHPQSFYGDARASSDFVGIAREALEIKEQVRQIYFTGCAGDITAGKYNDGSRPARDELAARLLAGMTAAASATRFQPVDRVAWRSGPLLLPLRSDPGFTLAESLDNMNNPRGSYGLRTDKGSMRLAFIGRSQVPIELSCLTLGAVRILHLPGEPMVAFQLFAQQLLPGEFVAVAGYSDGSPGYICTERAYREGGYEPTDSMVSPQAEQVLKAAIRDLVELPAARRRSDPPAIHSSWDDLTEGVKTLDQWRRRREVLKRRYLELICDDQKPARPPLNFQVHESVVVDGVYTRKLISYNVDADERAHAYLGVPLGLKVPAPAVVALHGTTAQGKEQTAGLSGSPDKAFLDHLCRRGFVVIAPDHFVAGHRIPPEGPYETGRFYQKHPGWTAVGKFTFEHSIAIDVLESLPEVDRQHIGTLGHSLGGHGAYFLAAYDERIKAAAGNCGATFFRHNKSVENWARDRWYVYLKNIRPGLMEGDLPPIDVHEIIALIAPRAYLDLLGLNDGDPLTQRQRILMLTRIMDVYELEKAPANFAFYAHGRGHSVAYESRELMYGWMETHLKPPEATQAHLVGTAK